jgi:hypothetical protein
MGEPLRGKKLWLARSISVLVGPVWCPRCLLNVRCDLELTERRPKLDVNHVVNVTDRVNQVPMWMNPWP